MLTRLGRRLSTATSYFTASELALDIPGNAAGSLDGFRAWVTSDVSTIAIVCRIFTATCWLQRVRNPLNFTI